MNAAMAEEAKQLEVAAVAEIGNRVTEESINAKIKDITTYRLPDTTMTVAVLTLENGWVQEGFSACVDPANFDEQVGKEMAINNAYEKIWPLEGYLQKECLFRDGLAKSEGVGIAAGTEAA